MSVEAKDLEVTIRRLEERLEVLEAEAAIRRLVAAHQWANDGGDSSLALPDWSGVAPTEPPSERRNYWVTHGGTWRGSGLSQHFDGNTEIEQQSEQGARFGAERPRWMPRMMHFLTNEQITVKSSTRASGRWYSWEAATVRVDGGHQAIWIAGRYDCEFEREKGEWRIRSMHFQEVFSTPVDDGWIGHAHVPYGPGQLSQNDRGHVG